MCRNIESATRDCAFKIHDLKCPKGHPLHLSAGKTFVCCRSGCGYFEFVDVANYRKVNVQIKGN